MCGRFTLAGSRPQELRDRFGIDPAIPLVARWNIAPGQQVLALTGGRGGRPHGELVRWGLLPGWSKRPAGGAPMINARAETVAERQAFRDAFERRRCLIPADGFYEWQRRPAGPAQPWWFARDDGEPFAFAGLWEEWLPDPGAAPVRTCAIITTGAAPVVAAIHDRMPAILKAESEAAWLADGAGPEALLPLLHPLEEGLVARPVSTAVNAVTNDGPELLEHATEQPPNTLF
ncbi:unannotated protein [freshwater metagenome]|uniref:Unannotated protein n=1 Tax=freshwater metagenome TaxID=449393 RepID=A0A6J7I0W6_9ZZZZ|nr:hypothetical protein [Actinomycetota bacterium]